MSPRAYDLVGDMEAPAEVFPRLQALGEMAETLRGYGYGEAAEDTEALLMEARVFADRMQERTTRLRGLWKAFEMTGVRYALQPEERSKIEAAAAAHQAADDGCAKIRTYGGHA